ncbi:hypothetical protein AN958_06142 [Leucoagaricus sp. SymC.cos]|nr:hypothetical protein AN958_06142 [Leucoagaricus sp. SymC.cos]
MSITLGSIFDVVEQRVDSLGAIYKQVHIDLNTHLENFALGMFHDFSAHNYAYGNRESLILSWQDTSKTKNESDEATMCDDPENAKPIFHLDHESTDNYRGVWQNWPAHSFETDDPQTGNIYGFWTGAFLSIKGKSVISVLGLTQLCLELDPDDNSLLKGFAVTFSGRLELCGRRRTVDATDESAAFEQIDVLMWFDDGYTVRFCGKFDIGDESLSGDWSTFNEKEDAKTVYDENPFRVSPPAREDEGGQAQQGDVGSQELSGGAGSPGGDEDEKEGGISLPETDRKDEVDSTSEVQAVTHDVDDRASKPGTEGIANDARAEKTGESVDEEEGGDASPVDDTTDDIPIIETFKGDVGSQELSGGAGSPGGDEDEKEGGISLPETDRKDEVDSTSEVQAVTHDVDDRASKPGTEGIANDARAEKTGESVDGEQGGDTSPVDDTTDDIPIIETFIFRRTPVEIFHFRDLLREEENQAKARWNFLRESVLHLVRRRLWSWKHIKAWGDDRRKFFDFYKRSWLLNTCNFVTPNPVTSEENLAWRDLKYRLPPGLIRLCVEALNWSLYRLPFHYGINCDGCSYRIIEVRFVCLTCMDPEMSNSFDLCSQSPETYICGECERKELPVLKDGPGSQAHRVDHHLLRIHNLETDRFEREKLDQTIVRINALETAVNGRFEALESAVETRITALESKVEARLASFDSILRRIALQLNVPELEPEAEAPTKDVTVTGKET